LTCEPPSAASAQAVRDDLVKKLDTLVAKEEQTTAAISAALVADAAAAVTAEFAKAEVKTKALDEAIGALSSGAAPKTARTGADDYSESAPASRRPRGTRVPLPRHVCLPRRASRRRYSLEASCASPEARRAVRERVPQVMDLFVSHIKKTGSAAKAQQGKEVALSATAIAELNDELAALAKRDGYDGPVATMPAKVAV